MIKYMYIAPGQGQTAPRGQNFDVNRKALSLYPIIESFKEILYIFHNFIHVYGGRGHTDPKVKVLMSTESFYHFGHLF